MTDTQAPKAAVVAKSAVVKTPGYNCRLQIAFSTDRRGRPLAYYLSRACGFRWIRMGFEEAKSFVATEAADGIQYLGRNA